MNYSKVVSAGKEKSEEKAIKAQNVEPTPLLYELGYVEVQINRVSLFAFVHTGKARSSISLEVAEQCGLGHFVDYRFQTSAVESIVGRIAKCELELGGVSVSWTFNVTSDTIPQMILGNDFLTVTKANYDFKLRELQIAHDESSFILSVCHVQHIVPLKRQEPNEETLQMSQTNKIRTLESLDKNLSDAFQQIPRSLFAGQQCYVRVQLNGVDVYAKIDTEYSRSRLGQHTIMFCDCIRHQKTLDCMLSIGELSRYHSFDVVPDATLSLGTDFLVSTRTYIDYAKREFELRIGEDEIISLPIINYLQAESEMIHNPNRVLDKMLRKNRDDYDKLQKEVLDWSLAQRLNYKSQHQKFIAVVILNGVQRYAIIDTEVRCSIMSDQTADRCGLLQFVDPRGRSTLDGNIKTIGRIRECELKVGGWPFICSFHITRADESLLVIGLDLLEIFKEKFDKESLCTVHNTPTNINVSSEKGPSTSKSLLPTSTKELGFICVELNKVKEVAAIDPGASCSVISVRTAMSCFGHQKYQYRKDTSKILKCAARYSICCYNW